MPGRRSRSRVWRMAGGECHMMIGLCEVNWGGCHEGDRSESMPALTLGQGVEQNFQRVMRHSTNDKIGILSHEGKGHGNPTRRHEHARKAPNKANTSQPQITRPQRVNIVRIRASLCKTNPISELSRPRHRRAGDAGSRHADKLGPAGSGNYPGSPLPIRSSLLEC
jgi:hypothetical protein